MKLIKRYKNGNYELFYFDNGTKIRVVPDGEEPKPEYPEGIDVCVSKKCSIGCPMCHEGATADGRVVDLDTIHSFFLDQVNMTDVEIAMGGGALSEIKPMLLIELFRDSTVFGGGNILNITINAHELKNEKFIRIVEEYIDKNKLRAVGISFDPSLKDEILSFARKHKSTVIHTILGITSKEDYEWMQKNRLKVLVLGYKTFRRGVSYMEKMSTEINKKIDEMKESFGNESFLRSFKVISFDNLALEQLQLKERIPVEVWNKYYMGEEGQFTMYVDLVDKTFAPNSTYPVEKRKKIEDYDYDITEMFKAVQTMN